MEVIISLKISVLVGVKVVKDEVEDAIFINPFFVFLKKRPKSSDLLCFGFYFCVFNLGLWKPDGK